MFNDFDWKKDWITTTLIAILTVLIGISVFFIITGCGIVKKSSNPTVNSAIQAVDEYVPEDNVVENYIEDFIEATTGIQTDLSPASPEPNRWEK